MSVPNKVVMLLAIAIFSAFCASAKADGLSDLKAALTRLQAQTPLKAMLDLQTIRRQGEGKEQEESSGHISLGLEDSTRGMQVLYGKELLSRAENEARAKGKDPKSKTPTVTALSEFDSSDARTMMSAVAGLSRHIEEGIFKGEKLSSYNGKPARVLNFEFSIDKLSERERKYVKKMESSLELWIAADGTPLASSSRQNGSGRAFVVVSFEQKYDEDCVYSLVGDRLLTVRKESRFSSSGAGEKLETKIVKTLNVQT